MRAQQETRACRWVEVHMTCEPDSSFCIDGPASDSTCIRAMHGACSTWLAAATRRNISTHMCRPVGYAHVRIWRHKIRIVRGVRIRASCRRRGTFVARNRRWHRLVWTFEALRFCN